MEQEVFFEVKGQAGIITLNRPKALNAITLNIVKQMTSQLTAWATDDKIAHVMIKAGEGRAFSAGGDIVQLYEWGQASDPRFIEFYRLEYTLNTLIKRYPKPYIALVDGIVMGGGVGVSFNGSHCVVGDNVLFSMPETGVGLFPDVGGTYFLPRCEGKLGMYLGLTGARLKTSDVMFAKLATRFVPSNDLVELEKAICESESVDDVLSHFAHTATKSDLATQMPNIDEFFGFDCVANIIQSLTDSNNEWAQKTAKILNSKSPTSLLITFRQLREGKHLTFEQAMALEFRLVNRIALAKDFFEGTRAVVIDKDMSPNWQPNRLADVSEDQINSYFAPLKEELWR